MTATCPACTQQLPDAPTGSLDPAVAAITCRACGWRGAVLTLTPKPRPEPTPEASRVADADDSRCIHHPNKPAVAVCTGTGSYICDLCRVELGGEPYSVQYLDGGGRAVVEERLSTRLPRPERLIGSLLLGSIFPYTALAAPGFCVWGWFLLAKARRLRRENPLYREVVGRGALTLASISMIVQTVLTVAIVAGIVFLILAVIGRSY